MYKCTDIYGCIIHVYFLNQNVDNLQCTLYIVHYTLCITYLWVVFALEYLLKLYFRICIGIYIYIYIYLYIPHINMYYIYIVYNIPYTGMCL